MSNQLLYCALPLAFLFSFLALFDASQSISTFGSVSRYAFGESVLPKKSVVFVWLAIGNYKCGSVRQMKMLIR